MVIYKKVQEGKGSNCLKLWNISDFTHNKSNHKKQLTKDDFLDIKAKIKVFIPTHMGHGIIIGLNFYMF